MDGAADHRLAADVEKELGRPAHAPRHAGGEHDGRHFRLRGVRAGGEAAVELRGIDHGAGFRRWPLRRSATISARIESAISSGVMAPRSSPAGALSAASRAGVDAALGELGLQRLGLPPAADEGDVVGVDRQRRLQRRLVAAALGRDDDEARALAVRPAARSPRSAARRRRRPPARPPARRRSWRSRAGGRGRRPRPRPGSIRRRRSRAAAAPARRRCPSCPGSGTCSWRSGCPRARRPAATPCSSSRSRGWTETRRDLAVGERLLAPP